jgi:hypothetical protein
VRLLLVTLVALIAVSSATARDTRSQHQAALRHSNHVLTFFANHSWLQAPFKESCSEVPWTRSCRIARELVRDHTWQRKHLRHLLWVTLPSTNDWQTAVRIVQRLYPGTESWMLAISDREGGWSSWVWYGGRPWTGYHVGDDFLGMDTVGGWMQFRYSTFAPYWRGALKDLRARGFVLPEFPDRGGPAEYQPWLDPLGQALTAGYMRYYGKDGCHWCL